MRSNTRFFFWTAVAVVTFALMVGWGLWYSFGTEATVTITPTHVERIQDGNSSKYMIYSDTEQFENTDAPLHGKFNSSDLYAKIHPGTTYVCKVNGLRVPFFSSYRNLLSCKAVA